MKARALVLKEFHKPLEVETFDLPTPGRGEILARIMAAGVCGSDMHMWEGKDPRTPLPIILGHEGVGEVVEVGEGATDAHGDPLKPGDPIVWERSLTCGECDFCNRGETFLCPSRKVYGINISSADPPYLSGNYADHILLKNGTSIFPLEPGDDPGTLVAATCSGTTAAHAHEKAGIVRGDNVVIFGAGPVGIFQAAFAKREGAEEVIVITNSPGPKADMITKFGADDVLIRKDSTPEQRHAYIMDMTDNTGVDVIIDTTPDPSAFLEAMPLIRRGGKYLNSGAAVPGESVPLDIYHNVTFKCSTIKGIWASDTSHLEMSLELVRHGGYPFEQLVTHRFTLEEHEKAWGVYRDKKGVKIIFEP